ncbi:MAG: Fpg/Nei family DNA glycosylase [Phycisphaerales bacterium]
MPELPEVERARRQIESVGVGRTITRCRCANDRIVFDGVNPVTFGRTLKGRTIVAARRRGKQMWIELDERPWPTLHLGMTGHVRSPDDEGIKYEAGAKQVDTSWPPKFWKVIVELDDGGMFSMTNPRRLGRIRLKDDPEHEPPISKLGFDPLLGMPNAAAFRDLIRKRRGGSSAKGLLMDQSFAAGVGNWIADEVLYQAKIDPRRTIGDLDDADIIRMRTKLGSVITKACAVNADKRDFPRTWLFHRRWGKDPDARTHDGHPIEHLTIGGRTTAWVPAKQR